MSVEKGPKYTSRQSITGGGMLHIWCFSLSIIKDILLYEGPFFQSAGLKRKYPESTRETNTVLVDGLAVGPAVCGCFTALYLKSH